MSYFSQKKKQQKENTFFKTALVVFVGLTLLIFFSNQDNTFLSIINGLRFQLYILICFFMLLALINKRFFECGIFVVIACTNYFYISSNANLLKNVKIENANSFVYDYKEQKPLMDYESAGMLVFSSKNIAPYYMLNFNKRKLRILQVDFSQEPNLENALIELENFIIQQDESIIIVGDLGTYAWSNIMKKFLQRTGLRVKNRIIFSGLNPLEVPKINVLGFNNIGIKEILQKNNQLSFILLAK